MLALPGKMQLFLNLTMCAGSFKWNKKRWFGTVVQDGAAESCEELQLLPQRVPREDLWLSWGCTMCILKKCFLLLTEHHLSL